jgi:hypothetical protein
VGYADVVVGVDGDGDAVVDVFAGEEVEAKSGDQAA